MTKADLLRKLRNLPMNTPIVFVDAGKWRDDEFQLEHAFTVTGPKGLCLVLAESPAAAHMYDDAEEVL